MGGAPRTQRQFKHLEIQEELFWVEGLIKIDSFLYLWIKDRMTTGSRNWWQYVGPKLIQVVLNCPVYFVIYSLKIELGKGLQNEWPILRKWQKRNWMNFFLSNVYVHTKCFPLAFLIS